MDGFVRKVTTKFSKIQVWAASHTHVVPPCIAGCTTAPGVPVLTLTRSLVWKNATEEEYNQAMSWINQTLSNSNLTNGEETIKDFLISNPSLISAILGPVVEDIYHESLLADGDQVYIGEKENEEKKNEIEIIDLDLNGKPN